MVPWAPFSILVVHTVNASAILHHSKATQHTKLLYWPPFLTFRTRRTDLQSGALWGLSRDLNILFLQGWAEALSPRVLELGQREGRCQVYLFLQRAVLKYEEVSEATLYAVFRMQRA